MKNFFKKYKKAIPFIVAAAVIGSAVMTCVTLGVVGSAV